MNYRISRKIAIWSCILAPAFSACQEEPALHTAPPPSGGLLPPPAATAVAHRTTDEFERPKLGSNWTILAGPTNCRVAILHSSDLGCTSTANRSLGIVMYTGRSFSKNQFSAAVFSSNYIQANTVQVTVRVQPTNERYGFMFVPEKQQWQIKHDGLPNADVIASSPGISPRPGDVIRIEVYGTKITGKVNGETKLTAADTRLTRGFPGIAMRTLAGPASNVERWAGGDLQ
jgi:hypothetical protein